MPRHPPCALSSLTLRQAHSAIIVCQFLGQKAKNQKLTLSKRFMHIYIIDVISIIYYFQLA